MICTVISLTHTKGVTTTSSFFSKLGLVRRVAVGCIIWYVSVVLAEYPPLSDRNYGRRFYCQTVEGQRHWKKQRTRRTERPMGNKVHREKMIRLLKSATRAPHMQRGPSQAPLNAHHKGQTYFLPLNCKSHEITAECLFGQAPWVYGLNHQYHCGQPRNSTGPVDIWQTIHVLHIPWRWSCQQIDMEGSQMKGRHHRGRHLETENEMMSREQLKIKIQFLIWRWDQQHGNELIRIDANFRLHGGRRNKHSEQYIETDEWIVRRIKDSSTVGDSRHHRRAKWTQAFGLASPDKEAPKVMKLCPMCSSTKCAW